MNRKRTWKERDRWNTVAYQTYRDSREWRHLLELNPAYDIRYRPAAGVNINIEGPVAAGKPQPSGFGILDNYEEPTQTSTCVARLTTSRMSKPTRSLRASGPGVTKTSTLTDWVSTPQQVCSVQSASMGTCLTLLKQKQTPNVERRNKGKQTEI